jgi:pimeloyl-ACP methyl ester carboxylesterase
VGVNFCPSERHAVDVPGGRLSLVLHLPDITRGAVPCVIACHGLGASKDSDKYLLLGAEVPAAGFALARFDFRGCGESSGVEEETTIATRIEDVDAVLGHLASDPRLSGAFGLLGSSMGGFVALHVAARAHVGGEAGGDGAGAPDRVPPPPDIGVPRHLTGRPDAVATSLTADVRAVVTWNAPSNLHELANDERHDGHGIGVPLFLELASHRYDTAPAGVSRHLIIQGDADDVVPVDHGVLLHERAADPCDIVIISGGDHRLTEPQHRRQAVDVSLAWFQRFLGHGPSTTETSS